MTFHGSGHKNIIIIGTGGTIAGTGEAGKTVSYRTGQIEVDKLISGIEDLESLANVSTKELLSIDSCDMTVRDWLHLANYINEMSSDNEVDGFVVTHGTDTLEETAFFLNLTVKTVKPVVITGSMRPATAMSPDGPFNLYQSVALARDEDSVGKGVIVAFSDAIYGARDINKINTYRTNAFGNRDLGCLGYIRDEKVYFYNESVKTHTFKSEFDISGISELPHVGIVYFYADADPGILDYMAQNFEGIVVAGAGCGGCSIIWNKKLRELALKGIPVVRSSRISNGLVTGEPNEQKKPREIYANTLSPQKSRILLSLALSRTRDIEEICNIFEKY